MRGEGGVAGLLVKVELLVYQSFICGISAPCHLQISTQIGCPMLPLVYVLYWVILYYICRSFKLHLGV